jgi:hypothetical protein
LLAAITDVRSTIRSASMLGWVDAGVFVRLTDATLDVLGLEEGRQFWARRLLDAFESPLMRPLAKGSLRLFGRNPGSIIRMTPQAYALTYKDCGTPHVEVEPGRARMRIVGLPGVLRVPSLIECYTGHCLAASLFSSVEVDIGVDRAGLDADGDVTWTVTWPARA